VTDGQQHPVILASDAEREAAVDRLRRAVVDGRLTLEEFSDRVGLAQARMPGPEVELKIFNLFGTVTLIVPEGVRVSLEGGGPFASQVIHSPQVPPVEGAPVLRIKASGPGGTLDVRNQRERPNRLAKLLGKGDPSA
jgi:hypothetical protein